MKLEEQLEFLKPSNATDYTLIPFEDFVGDCAHLFEEGTFKEQFKQLLEKESSKKNVIRVLIDNYHFGDMTRVFDDETNEEFVVEWEFE